MLVIALPIFTSNLSEPVGLNVTVINSIYSGILTFAPSVKIFLISFNCLLT